jgi:pimeloyl-ACP methyl ester carboxylesterase
MPHASHVVVTGFDTPLLSVGSGLDRRTVPGSGASDAPQGGLTSGPMPSVRTSDGVRIAVLDFGGDGPDLVMAHPTGFHAATWGPVARLLTDHFHCVALDLRGHGDSDPDPHGDYHWSGFARDCLAVVDGLSLENPLGVGHSCGGASLLLAELDRPSTFRALYCYEPIVIPSEGPPGPNPENHLAAGARRRREIFPSRQAAYDNYASKPPFDILTPEALRAYVDYGFADLADGTVRLKCRREIEAAVFSESSSHDAFDRLDQVRCPVTLACGELTDTFGPAVMERLAERLPRARVAALAGLGHFGPQQDPEAVAAAILSIHDPVTGRS